MLLEDRHLCSLYRLNCQNPHLPGSINVLTPGMVRRARLYSWRSICLSFQLCMLYILCSKNITGLTCCYAQKLSSCSVDPGNETIFGEAENGGEWWLGVALKGPGAWGIAPELSLKYLVECQMSCRWVMFPRQRFQVGKKGSSQKTRGGGWHIGYGK
jgi:hypothetical protein